MVKSYCVKEKKQTESVSGTEYYVKTKNNRTMMKSTCSSCGITKTTFISKKEIQGQGYGIGESLLKGISGILYESGKHVLKQAVKSDLVKKKASTFIKNKANKMIDQGVSQTLDQLGSGRKRGGKLDIQEQLSKLGELHM